MTSTSCGHHDDCPLDEGGKSSSHAFSTSRHARRRKLDRLLVALCFAFIAWTLISIALNSSAHAAEDPLISQGTGVVTTFSGTSQSPSGVAGDHPQDRTLIDPAGSVLRVLDLTNLGGSPHGQFVDLPAKLAVPAREIGQVFGVVIADTSPGVAPDIYTGASSLFGLQIVKPAADGKLMRLVRGAPGAQWAPGQFGLDLGGGPGTIWKIDGASGKITPFATVVSGVDENAGPGIGALAFDPVSHVLFAASLETGLIHRIDLTGRDLGVFDHGLTGRGALMLPPVLDDAKARMSIHDPAFNVEDPATWGYADKKRRVTALTIESGRLYYAVAEGPSLWSVGLAADGSLGNDVKLEIDVKGTPDNNPVTAIAFDGSNRVFLTQRGDVVGSYDYAALARPRTSVVYRFTRGTADQAWNTTPDEYAVGMPSPHRATNGGAALSYGYDDAGRAEFGRCRATLWTTGEGLRADAQGRLVDGLQGADTSAAQAASASRARTGSEALQGDFGLYESDLAPPDKSWFVPVGNGSRDRHGQVGALAIHAPCEAEIASAPAAAVPERPPVFVIDPDHLPPGIHIAKVCHPGPLGGVIPCTITVTNVGWTLTGDVGFSDASTVLAGPDKGAAVLITSATPDGADWMCSPTPSATFGCSLPFTALLPGQSRSVKVFVNTGPLVASGNTGFRNCASLALPWSGVACVDSQTQILVKKKAPASCLPGAACTFELSVTNSGTLPFAGDVLLSDSLFIDGGGAPVAAPITAIVPALGCAPDPGALPFSCTAPVSLTAGETKTFSITATMPALPPNYWGHNCFSASAPGQPAPLLPPGPGVDLAAVSCAWVPVGAPPPLANLQIGKSPLECHKQGADHVRCHYDITLANTGPSPSIAPVTFTETVPANSALASIAAPWSCIGGPPLYTCTTAAPPVIAPAASLTIPVAIDLERAPLEAAKCWAPNHVSITAPAGGTPANFKVVDDSALATADAAWIRFDEGGPLELVLCDPTNLRTTKVADGPCVVDGSNFRCGYTVTITNTGPDPFKGRIDVTDTFDAVPVDVKFPADWDCGGAGANWTCSHAPLDLAKGDSVSMAVSAKFAKNGGRCVVSNRATMIFPPANTRWNQSGADDSATAFSPIPSRDCDVKPACEAPAPGEARTVSGACACASGHARDRKGRCVPIVVAEPMPEPESPTPTPTCVPGPDEYRTASGACVCKSGFSRRDGRCVTIGVIPLPPTLPLCEPGPNEVRDRNGRCVCRDGFSRNRDGRCVPEIAGCIPGPNEHRTSNGRCVCDAGYDRDRNGRCVPEKPDVCPPGTFGKPPACKPKVCDDGYTGKWPDCRPIACPPGMTGKPPKCVAKPCPFGTTGTPPNCKPIEKPKCPLGQIGTPPNCRPMLCPPGTTGKPPNCKPIDKPKCPPGTVGKPPRCVKVVVPCAKGEIRNDKGQCVPRKVVTPPKTTTPKLDTKTPIKIREPSKPVPDIR
jgi:hypothetical protein